MIEGVFDIYGLLVETIFGSIFLSLVGIMIAMILICILCRMSPLLIIMLCGTAFIVFMTGYYGSIFMAAALLGALLYFGAGLLNMINARRYA